jgi:short-subunit dehydrogenase
MSPFEREVILITGAGSGLGREMARRLTALGACVAGVDRQPEALESLAEELHGRTFAAAVADVTERAALLAAVHRLEEQLGPCDRLIANAGIGRATQADPFSSADFEEIIRVNLIGVANSVEAVLPGMIERRKGHLVAISSMASYRGLPLMSAYCASKSGVNALFDSLASELRPHNIQVSTICPSWVRTPLTEQVKVKMPHLMEPEAAVDRILAVMRKRKRFHAFPMQTRMLLRLLRLLPPTWTDRIMGNVLKTGQHSVPAETVPG